MSTNADEGADLWVGLGLAEAASTARVGPAPVAEILAGGRRIRRRRRTVVGALALASAVVLAGGAVTELRPGPVASHPLVPAGAGHGSGTGGPPTTAANQATPATPATPATTAAAPPVRDPFTPVRAVVGEGTTPDGKQWKLWRAVWPTAPRERAYEQALALWQERSPYDSAVDKPTKEFVDQYYDPNADVTNTYFTVDGVRLSHDATGTSPAPGKLDPRAGTYIAGGLLGARGKGDTVAPDEIVGLTLGPDIARVKVTWTDGTVTEPPLVTVGDSPMRAAVVARPAGKTARLWEYFDRDGRTVPDSGEQFLTR
ncbi:hypothetical protein ACIRVF_09180 [Kitasatospora sp. NPDC101157]|uniref:hypothetical protein n=1 Tax=Kitasatospora sp. NPDC101157 TaxID=3364098 RepID=UPI0037FD6459